MKKEQGEIDWQDKASPDKENTVRTFCLVNLPLIHSGGAFQRLESGPKGQGALLSVRVGSTTGEWI